MTYSGKDKEGLSEINLLRKAQDIFSARFYSCQSSEGYFLFFVHIFSVGPGSTFTTPPAVSEEIFGGLELYSRISKRNATSIKIHVIKTTCQNGGA